MLYTDAIKKAIQIAEEKFGISLPSQIVIDYRGPNCSGFIGFDEAFDCIYLGEDQFLFLINVLVNAYSREWTQVGIWVTGHPLVDKFDRTFNHAQGTGPFNQLILMSELMYVEI